MRDYYKFLVSSDLGKIITNPYNITTLFQNENAIREVLLIESEKYTGIDYEAFWMGEVKVEKVLRGIGVKDSLGEQIFEGDIMWDPTDRNKANLLEVKYIGTGFWLCRGNHSIYSRVEYFTKRRVIGHSSLPNHANI